MSYPVSIQRTSGNVNAVRSYLCQKRHRTTTLAAEGAFEGCAAVGVIVNEGADRSGVRSVHQCLLRVGQPGLALASTGVHTVLGKLQLYTNALPLFFLHEGQ